MIGLNFLNEFKKVALVLLLVLSLFSCRSLGSFSPTSNYIACKLELKVPRESGKTGSDKVNGLIRMYDNEFIRISFRAPVVRSEMFVIEYSKDQLLLIDRMSKIFSVVPSPDLAHLKGDGFEMLSFVEMEVLILKAASSKSARHLTARQLGIDLVPNSKIELSKFTNAEFRTEPLRTSSKYVEVSVADFYENFKKY